VSIESVTEFSYVIAAIETGQKQIRKTRYQKNCGMMALAMPEEYQERGNNEA
jgi:hypothetical protein